ncbi:MAG: DUF2167 domain-containing protein [Pseudomonadota bacterium]
MSRKSFLPRVVFFISSLFMTTRLIWAQEEESSMTEEQFIQSILDGFDKQTGSISLPGGFATLNIPEDYYFLNSKDSRTVLEDLWGNPPGNDVLGMIFPAKYTAMDMESWAVTVTYEEEGYISDADAADIDYADLLKSMQKGTSANNKARAEMGYESIELLGWAEPPHYDSTAKKLYWGKELAFAGAEGTTLNYDIRALGRRGVLSMTFIAQMTQLDEINQSRDIVLGMADFDDGHKYSDFNPDIDKVAAYGIGALVAGKVASKAGLWASLLLLLKKFYIFILIGLVAAGNWLKGFFTKKDSTPHQGESS